MRTDNTGQAETAGVRVRVTGLYGVLSRNGVTMGAKESSPTFTESDSIADSAQEPTKEGVPADDGTGSAETESPPEPPLDLVFGILKNSRRRKVLRYLCSNDGTATLSDLAEHIAAIENDTTPAQLSSSQRKRVYVGLYQCHLPKMDDVGVIDYNQARGHIELTDLAPHFEAYLDRDDDERGREWHRYYGGIAAASIAALAGTAVLAPGQAILFVSLGLASVWGGCSVWHWHSVENADED